MSDLSPDTLPQIGRGWTPERKVQFLDHLARRGNVRAACRRVGLSHEAAYTLRRRDRDFARGWAAALVLAHAAGLEVLRDRAIDGVEEDVWYRGELVGTRRKYDSRLLLAHLGRLDKQAEDAAAMSDAERFDELLACIGGERVPNDLSGEDGLLPLTREEAAHGAAAEAEGSLRTAGAGENAEGLDEEAALAAYRCGEAAGLTRWDAWFDNACSYVDFLVERDGSEDSGGEAEISPWTVSDVSSCCPPASGGEAVEPPSPPA